MSSYSIILSQKCCKTTMLSGPFLIFEKLICHAGRLQ